MSPQGATSLPPQPAPAPTAKSSPITPTTVDSWEPVKVKGERFEIPTGWKKTVIPGADQAFQLVDGNLVGITKLASTPTTITLKTLNQIAGTVQKLNPGVTTHTPTRISSSVGFIVFPTNVGQGDLYQWLVSSSSATFTITLAASNKKGAPVTNPMPVGAGEVETFVQKLAASSPPGDR